ncbi:thymidylate synthase [Tenacibaculum phage Larrie]|nr:thymidylate synthase [Tenacibaculum phage Larrie]
MAVIDRKFQSLVKDVMIKGRLYTDESRDTQRLQIPKYSFRHEVKDGTPFLTIKELKYDMVLSELLWFLRGDNHIKYLRDNDNPIWNKDAYNWYVKHMGIKKSKENYKRFLSEINNPESFAGKVGYNYSKAWREGGGDVDQIRELISGMKLNIMSTRLIVQAWIPSKVKKTALPPCHTGFQVVGVPLTEKKIKRHYEETGENITHGFELHWQQRSSDLFLGVPFNIASYYSLGKILEEETGYKFLAVEGDLRCVHIYKNAFRACEQLLRRSSEEIESCDFKFIPNKGQSIESVGIDEYFKGLTLDNFKISNYKSLGEIKVPMLAPKNI